MSADNSIPSKVPLLACRFCQQFPEVEIQVGEGPNKIYTFAIKHSCCGFDGGHLSLFFQNQTPEEKCIETLRNSITMYSAVWNHRNAISDPNKTIEDLRELVKSMDLNHANAVIAMLRKEVKDSSRDAAIEQRWTDKNDTEGVPYGTY